MHKVDGARAHEIDGRHVEQGGGKRRLEEEAKVEHAVLHPVRKERELARLADEDMVTAFNEMMLDASVKPEGMTAKIKALVLIRLEQASPHKEVVRATLRYLRNPKQAKLGQQLLFQTIDQMWRAAGDDATDFSFYTKRGLLAAVYSATLLYFMADNTGSMDGTSAFLDRRLKEVLKLPKLSKPMQKQASVIASGLGKTVSSIAKNISQQMARRGY